MKNIKKIRLWVIFTMFLLPLCSDKVQEERRDGLVMMLPETHISIESINIAWHKSNLDIEQPRLKLFTDNKDATSSERLLILNLLTKAETDERR